ncbi:hypothetical protein ABPG72_022051 [Tetrahymena utriculariae]
MNIKKNTWALNENKKDVEVKVKNYIDEDSETHHSQYPTHNEESIEWELDQVYSMNDSFNDQKYKSKNQDNKDCNHSQQYLNSFYTNSNFEPESYDIEMGTGQNIYTYPASECSRKNEQQPSEHTPLKSENEPESSQVNESEQSDSQTQEEDCSNQSSRLTMNQFGQKSCEETKNLFILTIPYIISRLNGSSKEKCRWEYASQINGLVCKKKMNTLQKFNELLKEIEQKSEENPKIVKTFRESVVDILEHDYIKYATNQKDYKTQAILLKYLQPIKLIALSKSYTFSSVKYVKKLLEKKTRRV